ncbi:TPA: hypothetical protein I7730_14655 [Vibrio vulnificus]|uniref:Uncharacterized protein n=1 Tax=Vibrio vulnificus TaxID=672 RepID=A0A8H9N1B7_VIBVL|nr:hypothetical protein [Vibrio vulnificus]HAS8541017.1 hypothetical protein [Vibrio vulnificus]
MQILQADTPNNVVEFPHGFSLKKATSKADLTSEYALETQKEIIELAQNLPDYDPSFYKWYTTIFMFGRGVEIRDIKIERKLRDVRVATTAY